LVRALGFAAAAAPVIAAQQVLALPTISPDLVADMREWQSAYIRYKTKQESMHRRPWSYATWEKGLTPEYEELRGFEMDENSARMKMLRSILQVS
jgi:hypothetical protein